MNSARVSSPPLRGDHDGKQRISSFCRVHRENLAHRRSAFVRQRCCDRHRRRRRDWRRRTFKQNARCLSRAGAVDESRFHHRYYRARATTPPRATISALNATRRRMLADRRTR